MSKLYLSPPFEERRGYYIWVSVDITFEFLLVCANSPKPWFFHDIWDKVSTLLINPSWFSDPSVSCRSLNISAYQKGKMNLLAGDTASFILYFKSHFSCWYLHTDFAAALGIKVIYSRIVEGTGASDKTQPSAKKPG